MLFYVQLFWKSSSGGVRSWKAAVKKKKETSECGNKVDLLLYEGKPLVRKQKQKQHQQQTPAVLVKRCTGTSKNGEILSKTKNNSLIV